MTPVPGSVSCPVGSSEYAVPCAGVDVTATRYEGIIHDFVMLNALRGTNAAGAAIAQAITYLRVRLGTS